MFSPLLRVGAFPKMNQETVETRIYLLLLLEKFQIFLNYDLIEFYRSDHGFHDSDQITDHEINL